MAVPTILLRYAGTAKSGCPTKPQCSLRTRLDGYYRGSMAKTKEFNLDRPTPSIETEDEKTLAAIDEGIRDAKAGRTTSLKEVRKLLQEVGIAEITDR